MQFKRSGLLVVVLSVFILILSACAPAPAAQPTDEVTPEPTEVVTDEPVVTEEPVVTDEPTADPQGGLVPADDVLVQILRTGGHCMGSCDWTLTITQNGHFVADGNFEGSDLEGDLTEEELLTLRDLIAETDFEAIQNTPFTDTCPIAYDGQKSIYTIANGEEVIVLDNCEVTVDPASPLFALLEVLIAKAQPITQ
jgi:hypothetical protein